MSLRFKQLTPCFVGEASPIDLRTVHDRETLEQIRAGMDQYGVLIFRDQHFSDAEQLDFAQRFDGTLHAKTSTAVLTKNRFGNEALTDVSNVNDKGEILSADDRRRASSVSRLLSLKSLAASSNRLVS